MYITTNSRIMLLYSREVNQSPPFILFSGAKRRARPTIRLNICVHIQCGVASYSRVLHWRIAVKCVALARCADKTIRFRLPSTIKYHTRKMSLPRYRRPYQIEFVTRYRRLYQRDFVDDGDHIRILRFTHCLDGAVTQRHKSLRLVVCAFPLLELPLLWFGIIHQESILHHEEPVDMLNSCVS